MPHPMSRNRARGGHAVDTPEHLLSVEEFLAFVATRADGEKWEMIEGVAVLSPMPTDIHQIVVANITYELMQHGRRSGAGWLAMPGTGTRGSNGGRNLPQPDVIVKEQPPTGAPFSDEALVIVEVLSHANIREDRAWRKHVYASVPNCQHYVTVSLKRPEVIVSSRATGWGEHKVGGSSATVDLPALGLSLPLADIYRSTPLGTSA